MRSSPARREALVRLSARLAAWSRGEGGGESGVRAALADAAGAGVGDDAVGEALLQSHLFLGFPVALNALALWREVGGADPVAGSGADRPEAWADDRGVRTLERIYGPQHGALLDNVRDLHPAMERWVKRHGYGSVLSRTGLDLATRELCVAAMLARCDWPDQLHSHLRGALREGVAPSEVETMLTISLEGAPAPVRSRALSTWERVRGR